MNPRQNWLNNAIFYQIYPSSFYDSDGDGIGDLRGIALKLDYIEQLGCNGIWINPFFQSPFRDGGYDISDYKRVDRRFGTIDDAKHLFAEAKKRNIRVLLDLVPGHTSDRHRWFKASQRAERNRYSDYYIWTDSVWTEACGRRETNNLSVRSVNGMCERDGNYVVNFFSMQPALNYGYYRPTEPWQIDWRDERLKPLREELLDIMRFWLKAGCSGFRVDMAFSLIKNDDNGYANSCFWKEVLDRVRSEFPEAIFVSEWADPENSVGRAGFDMDFLLHFGNEAYTTLFRYEERGRESFFRENSAQTFDTFQEYFTKMQSGLRGNGFMGLPSGNHDMRRISCGRSEEETAVVFAFLLTFPAVPFLYYGDEIHMQYRQLPTKEGGYDRTGSRTPMQWSVGKNKGFSSSDKPYLPTEPEDGNTVGEMAKREGSLLKLVEALTRIRRAQPALGAAAEMRILRSADVLAYERKEGERSVLVVLNPHGRRCSFECDGYAPLLVYHAELPKGSVEFESVGFAILEKKI